MSHFFFLFPSYYVFFSFLGSFFPFLNYFLPSFPESGLSVQMDSILLSQGFYFSFIFAIIIIIINCFPFFFSFYFPDYLLVPQWTTNLAARNQKKVALLGQITLFYAQLN